MIPDRHSDAFDRPAPDVPTPADLAWEKSRTDAAVERARQIAYARFQREDPEGAARDPWAGNGAA